MGPGRQLAPVRVNGERPPGIEKPPAGGDMGGCGISTLGVAIGGQQLCETADRCRATQALPELVPAAFSQAAGVCHGPTWRGNSGLPQRLQKAAPCSWLFFEQVGQLCLSRPSPPRMAVASSAVKIPVGTAMIE